MLLGSAQRLAPLAGFGPVLSHKLRRGLLLTPSRIYLLGHVVKNNLDFLHEQVYDSLEEVRPMEDHKGKIEEAAKALSHLGAAKGGLARAKKLSPEQRSQIARTAVETRWERAGKKPLPLATHVGELPIGEAPIACAVLEDGTRVLSERGMSKALGSKRGGSHWLRKRRAAEEGGADLPVYASANNLKPFIPDELALALSKPILYRVPGTGMLANGIDATNLPKLCEVYLKARRAGVLTKPQERIAMAAEILLAGLAHTGIVALVDEATGYQDERAKNALARILEAFIAKELRKWVRTFPTDYYKELFRLRGWKFPNLPADQRKRPILVGALTNNVVYDRLAPGVRAELKRLTPRDEKGRLKHKLFQRLTEDVGHPKLREHLAAVIALMRASQNWEQFMYMLDTALPKYIDTPLLPFDTGATPS
jgi:P63C domain